MEKNKLSLALGLALTGVLGLGASSAASAHVMYNTDNAGSAYGAGGTDGWSTPGSWVGTADGNAPFGYAGPVANWAAQLHSAGASLIVSSADALDDYDVAADIDTAKGAWNDGKFTQAADSQGWGHNTDVGLFKSNVTQTVTLTASNVDPNGWQIFGISVFSGMTTAGNYEHHGGWNIGYTEDDTTPATLDNPLGTVGLTFVGYTDNSTVTFTAQAGQVYSILLGGYSGSGNFGPHAGYQLAISSVPVPGAVWLFGTAMAGLIGIGGRRKISA
ncbi:MAG: hypothetical protein PHH11_02310 [Methylomonas sp.]|nr:hypothetical protein [Methylomonas sp.]